jgi:FkbM family methyltransferase
MRQGRFFQSVRSRATAVKRKVELSASGVRARWGSAAGYRPYEFAGGLIYLDLSESPMMRARAKGVYERAKVNFAQSYLRPGMTFVDVGANKGDFTLIAAKAVGELGRVLAFEPEPENCHWIRESIELNQYRNVELLRLALADAEGVATLYLGKKSGWHSLIASPKQQRAGGGAIRVRTQRLDEVLVERNCDRVDLVKIDVEGAELDVLRGAERTLAGNRQLALLLEIHPSKGVDPGEVCNLLAENGFSLREPQDPERPLRAIPDELTEVFALK